MRTFSALMLDGATNFDYHLLAVVVFLQGSVDFLDLFEPSAVIAESLRNYAGTI
jgi:hypothetical protein